ncbi:MAG: hypothetical protein SFU98_11010 [Leptospiraceae bacterium]|nr:hypothetical protein [Leptospiraceae bacterium]
MFVRSKFFIFIPFLILSCGGEKTDSRANLLLLGRIILNDQILVSGVAKGPGTLANAKVEVLRAPSSGGCVTSAGKPNGIVLSSTTTDKDGKYSLRYPRQGASVCVVVTPGNGTTMAISYAPTKPITWKGNINVNALFTEPGVSARTTRRGSVSTTPKTVNVSPFTRMASGRASALTQGVNRKLEQKSFFRNLFFKGNSRNTSDISSGARDVQNSLFTRVGMPNGLEEFNPDNTQFKLREGGILLKADNLSGGARGEINPETLEKLINFMEDDFSDGRFDGKRAPTTGTTPESIPSTELTAVGLDTAKADNFLKGEFLNAIKEFAIEDPSISDNAWRAANFCDEEGSVSCEVGDSTAKVYVFPEDGSVDNPTYPFAYIEFAEEMDNKTLTAQTADGTCSGTIQMSTNNFSSCIGFPLIDGSQAYTFDNVDPYYVMLFGTSNLPLNTTVKIRVLNTVKKLDGDLLLTSNFTSNGFTTFANRFSVLSTDNQFVLDKDLGILWRRCVIGRSGATCTGTSTQLQFCDTQDNDCNGGFDEGELDGELGVSTLFNACDALNSNPAGGLGGYTDWQVPHFFDATSFKQFKIESGSFATVFPNTGNFWTRNSFDLEGASYFNSGTNSIDYSIKDNLHFAYCVTYSYSP